MSVLVVAALLLIPAVSSSFQGVQKPSVLEILKAWVSPADLSTHFQSYTKSRSRDVFTAELKKQIKLLKPFSGKITNVLTHNTPFARGEWQSPDGLEKLTHWMQMQVLHLGSLRFSEMNCLNYQSEATTWLYFLAEMAYTESDGGALIHIGNLRKMLLEEIQSAVESPDWIRCSPDSSIKWWKSQRFPWPIDRAIVSEIGKHSLKPKERSWALKGALALQENPHQSFASWLALNDVFLSEGLKRVAKAWGHQHVALMQQEIRSHQNILLILMSSEFLKRIGHSPETQADLIKEGILSNPIIDPLTRQKQILPKK